jgi:hypothetical protein
MFHVERRTFLRSLVGGVATAAAVRTWPFRVYSFSARPAISPETARWIMAILHQIEVGDLVWVVNPAQAEAFNRLHYEIIKISKSARSNLQTFTVQLEKPFAFTDPASCRSHVKPRTAADATRCSESPQGTATPLNTRQSEAG